MLRGNAQTQYGGTPRHRSGGSGARGKEDAVLWLGGSPSKEPGSKRSRVNGALMVMVTALALAVLCSFTVFNSHSRSIAEWTYQKKPGNTVVPGRRHRKLERQPDQVQEQLRAEADGEGAAAQGQAEVMDSNGGAVRGEQQQHEAQGTEDGAAVGAMGQQADAAADASSVQHADRQQTEAQQEEQQAAQAQLQQSGETGAGGNLEAGDAGDDAVVESEPGGAQPGGGDGQDAYEVQPHAHAAGGQQQQQQKRRRKSPYQSALEKCETLACVKEAAAQQKRYKGQFLFPHFLMIGWQKCATTSLFHHLKDHPKLLMPIEKEPEFFSYDCQFDAESCPLDKQKEYIEETLHLNRALRHNLNSAMFEGSTHYAREGHRMNSRGHTFAQSVFEVFPWVKLIASMREPISRYLSMLGHNLDKNTYTCLSKHDSLFECLELELPWNNYTTPIQAWLDAFPAGQLMLLQYESLTSEEREADHLRAVKSFLGIDPDLPAKDLGRSNTRAGRLGHEPEGWTMQKWQYERLIEVVRPDVQSLATVVAKYGLGDPVDWMARWEEAWRDNLDACDADGNCSIH